MKKNILILVLIVGIITAAYLYSRKIMKSYGYKVSNILFNEFTLNKINGTVNVRFFNLNVPHFIIKKLVLKIYINDVLIDEVEQLTPTETDNGGLDIKLDFDVKPKEFLKLESLNLVLTKDKNIRYLGYAVIHKFFDFKIPIDYKFTMS